MIARTHRFFVAALCAHSVGIGLFATAHIAGYALTSVVSIVGLTMAAVALLAMWAGIRGVLHKRPGTRISALRAHSAALATANITPQALQSANDRLKTVQHVARIIGSANTVTQLDKLFRLVIEELRQAFGYQMVSIYLREGDGLRLQCALGYDKVLQFIALDQGVSGRVARTGQAVFVSNAVEDNDFIVVMPGTTQAIIVPLKRDDVVLGTLSIESTGDPRLTEDDYSLVNILADQFSMAVISVQLFSELSSSEERTRRLFNQRHRLLEVGQSMVDTLTLESILERFPAALAEVIDYTAFAMYVVDYEAKFLKPLLYRGPEHLKDVTHWQIPLGNGILSVVALSGEGLLINNSHLDPRSVYPEGARVDLEHTIMLPLRAKDQVFGVCAFMRLEDEPFTSEDYETAELFLSYTALAMTNAQLFADVQRSESRFRAALDGSQDEFFVFENVYDEHGSIIDFKVVELNRRAEDLLQQPREVLLTQSLRDLLSLSSELGTIQKYIEVAVRGSALSEELRFVQPSGNVAWRHHTIVPISDGIAITSRDITARREAESALIRLATLDVLTGVLNRRHFFELAEKELARARRYRHSLALVMLDIDDFKLINDAHGHLVGDRVLQQVAMCCRSAVRVIDLLGRYGGEEFIFLFPETELEGAVQTAERLRDMIAQQPVLCESGPVIVTVSIGMTILQADEVCDSIDVLVDVADRALYRAKRGGKNRVMVSQPRLPIPPPSQPLI